MNNSTRSSSSSLSSLPPEVALWIRNQQAEEEEEERRRQRLTEMKEQQNHARQLLQNSIQGMLYGAQDSQKKEQPEDKSSKSSLSFNASRRSSETKGALSSGNFREGESSSSSSLLFNKELKRRYDDGFSGRTGAFHVYPTSPQQIKTKSEKTGSSWSSYTTETNPSCIKYDGIEKSRYIIQDPLYSAKTRSFFDDDDDEQPSATEHSVSTMGPGGFLASTAATTTFHKEYSSRTQSTAGMMDEKQILVTRCLSFCGLVVIVAIALAIRFTPSNDGINTVLGGSGANVDYNVPIGPGRGGSSSSPALNKTQCHQSLEREFTAVGRQPDIFQQCTCFDNELIPFIKPSIKKRYLHLSWELRDYLLQVRGQQQGGIIINMNGTTKDSTQNAVDCNDPYDLALLWLAIDTEAKSAIATEFLIRRYVLALLYIGLDGPKSWKRKNYWLSIHHHECTWYGIRCVDSGNERGFEVVGLNLTDNHLKGNLSAYFVIPSMSSIRTAKAESPFSFLVDLIFSENLLDGHIPSQLLWGFPKLQRLELQGNKLSGTLPTTSTETNESESSLQQLDLSQNLLEGTIAEEFFNSMGQLKELFLGRNDELRGTLPTTIGRLSNLESFGAFALQLDGSIPTEIGQLTKLGHLYLSEGRLQGSIPTEIGLLSNVRNVDLSFQKLTGTLPKEVGNMTSLERFSCRENHLKGELPAEIGHLPNLSFMDAAGNRLSGKIPTSLIELDSLSIMRLNDNFFSGIEQTDDNRTALPSLNAVCFDFTNIGLDFQFRGLEEWCSQRQLDDNQNTTDETDTSGNQQERFRVVVWCNDADKGSSSSSRGGVLQCSCCECSEQYRDACTE